MRLKHKKYIIGKPNVNEGLEFIQNPVIEFNSSDYFGSVCGINVCWTTVLEERNAIVFVVDNGFKR